MILLLLIAAAIGFFWTRVLWAPSRLRTTCVWTSGAVIIACVLAIAANDAWHFGMHPTTHTQTFALAKRPLTAHRLGTTAREVQYTYTLTTTPTRQRVTRPTLTTSVHLRRTGQTGRVRITDQQLDYANRWSALLFAFSSQNGYHLHRTVTLMVPQDWTIQD
ncbi:MAG: DUF4811 domain-containing protein [Lactobacillus sp.]|jgi:hypothetical protein|nr:DUF4811 domain-containing protein [Lactobacillus sp.]MCI2032390.1 DUF4811 domain-containing protein [Lactobacillus sp.]